MHLRVRIPYLGVQPWTEHCSRRHLVVVCTYQLLSQTGRASIRLLYFVNKFYRWQQGILDINKTVARSTHDLLLRREKNLLVPELGEHLVNLPGIVMCTGGLVCSTVS